MPQRTPGSRHSTDSAAVLPWGTWHSKVRIAVLTAALFMALC